MFSLLCLCFVFYEEIYDKNGLLVRFYRHNISFLRTKCGEGSPWTVLWSFVAGE